MKALLRIYIPVAIIAAMLAGVLCLPDGSKMAMSEREPAWLIWTWKPWQRQRKPAAEVNIPPGRGVGDVPQATRQKWKRSFRTN